VHTTTFDGEVAGKILRGVAQLLVSFEFENDWVESPPMSTRTVKQGSQI